MVGGNIPGETRTVSISIYDSTQGLDYSTAGQTSLALLIFSVLVLTATYLLQRQELRTWPKPSAFTSAAAASTPTCPPGADTPATSSRTTRCSPI